MDIAHLELNEVERDTDWLRPQIALGSLLWVIFGIPTAIGVGWMVLSRRWSAGVDSDV